MTTTTPKPGDMLPYKHGRTIRVMAIGEGYMMVRYKGCLPFALKIAEYQQWEKKNNDDKFDHA